MNKKVKYIFIGLGLLLIILGLSLLLITGKESNNKSNSNGIEVDISQDDMTGDKINNSKYQVYESYIENAETYIKSNSMQQKNEYTFTYPTFLIETKLDDKNKHLFSDNLSIETFAFSQKSVEEYKKELLESYANSNILLQVYEHKEKINISGFDAYYLKLNYQEEVYNLEGQKETDYREKFVLMIEESDKCMVSFVITTTNMQLSNKAITDFINNIKVKKEFSIYTYGEINDTVVQGAIKQKRQFADQIYTIKYELSSNDYQEKPIAQNNIYKTRFESRNVDAFIDIEIHVDESNEFVEKYVEELKYMNSSDSETNFELQNVSYNGVNYSKIEFETYDSIDKVTKKKLYLIREMEKDIYYTVAFTSKDDVKEKMINDFLNVKYEIEYPNQENQE